jgi:hypothetical protein
MRTRCLEGGVAVDDHLRGGAVGAARDRAEAAEAGEDPRRECRLPPWALLAAEAVGLGVVGVWLFATAPAWWPWTLTPLVARAMSAWILGVAVVIGAAAWDDDRSRRVGACTFVALGALQLVSIGGTRPRQRFRRCNRGAPPAIATGAAGATVSTR